MSVTFSFCTFGLKWKPRKSTERKKALSVSSMLWYFFYTPQSDVIVKWSMIWFDNLSVTRSRQGLITVHVFHPVIVVAIGRGRDCIKLWHRALGWTGQSLTTILSCYVAGWDNSRDWVFCGDRSGPWKVGRLWLESWFSLAAWRFHCSVSPIAAGHL
jgi:hypothetical protein